LLEDAKPYPEWNTDYVMNDYFWLYENEAEQFVGNAGTSSYTASLEDLLRKALSETNTQKFSPIAEADLQTMLRTNRVLAVHFRMGFEFAALNNHVWTAYFVLSEGSNPGLKGTVFVDRDVRGSEYGSGNWTGWKISPFPIVWAVIISAITAAVGLGLLVYFRKRRKDEPP